MMKKVLFVTLAWLAVAQCVGCGQNRVQEAPMERPQVLIETSEGDIVVELYNETPLHRDNFLQQVRMGYLDSLLFHRVIRDFMIQGGDPTSRHAAKGELIAHEGVEPTLPAEFCYPQLFHKRGALAAAREGDEVNPDKESSALQFYIVCGRTFPSDSLLDRVDSIQYARNGVHMDKGLREYYRSNPGTPHLDGAYTVFGEVIGGMEVVDRIQLSATDSNDRPLQDVRILRTQIIGEE